MPSDKKLESLSETVRTGYKKEDLDKIISKLKRKDEAPVDPQKELNFQKVDLEEKGFMGFIAKFYSSFAKPTQKVAQFISNFPLVKSLEKNLLASRLRFNVETYLVIATAAAFIVGLLSFFLTSVLLYDSLSPAFSLVVGILVFVLMFVLTAVFVLVFPSLRAGELALAVDRALPFALRQLSTQLKAGFSFYKSLNSLAKADYGILSEEFELVLRDLDSGLSTDEALKLLTKRNKSEGLRKAILQITRAMRTGGSLATVISDIADDVSFETRQKIRDYTEKLNFINILYIMVGVVMPVAIAILSAILQIPLFAGALPSWFVYAGFGMSILFLLVILYAAQKMEPAAW
ncbi:TPA: type II secretion system F family protein [Candidatus Micrarchaeota archaeon]|nr:type II secretion system F family protein [Candidatus Micrarchaeota archaeon]